jgi:protein SCO1/2
MRERDGRGAEAPPGVSPRVPLLAVLALTLAACGSHAAHTVASAPPSNKRGFVLKPPIQAPGFTLRDQDGRLTGPRALRGHWFVVAFLYTHCPDVCPLIANNHGAAQRRLPDLRALAVSVDPAGDTPAAVRTFLRAHRLPSRFRYLTGTRAQLAPVWARYHVAAIAGPRPIVSHSAFELLVDPQGRERILYDAQLTAADVVRAIKMLD